VRRHGREIEVVTTGNPGAILDQLRARAPEDMRSEALTLEEISCSLYVSSLSSSAVRAMVNSIPVVIAGTVFVTASLAVVMSIGYRVIAGPYGQNRELLRCFEASSVSLYVWLALLLAGMFVWFALTNHRSTERRAQRVALQLVTLIVTALCCLALPLALYAR
jgi:hypothetical protein